MKKRILIDAREFNNGRPTGIGRVLEGLIDALSQREPHFRVVLGMEEGRDIPEGLKIGGNLSVHPLPKPLFPSEKALSDLTRQGFDLFISPYPKLPLFGCFCKSIHIIHDVLDLTYEPYRRRVRTLFDRYRLQRALRNSSMTWYDSEWSLRETVHLAGFAGRKPRVRYPGVDGKFTPVRSGENATVLHADDLAPGYVVVIGNGLPHKNLGILLRIASQIRRTFLFIGVPEENRTYWEGQYDTGSVRWFSGVADRDLPDLLRNAFCLAQPSLAEGYGYPPLEAMACGIPTVVSRIPVMMETTGGMALTADPADPGEWKKAFDRLEDPEVYRRIAEEGLRWIAPLRGPHSWEPYIGDVAEVLSNGG